MMDRRSCLRVALASLLTSPALAAEASPAADLTTDLEPLRRKYGLPALAAAVVKAGAIAAGGATGLRVLGRSDPVTISDRFHLGSDTKAMTATLAGMMVEAQKLAWTTTIGEALGPAISGINRALAAVTLEQLLSHSSGIPSDSEEMLGIYYNADALQHNIAQTRLDAFEKLKSRPPATPPGAEFHYSNFGYMIAGILVERAARISWEELIVERIFTPLGLASAGIGPQATTGRIDAAIGHDVDGDKVTPMLWGPAADVPPLLGPAGAAHMSILDFAAWAGWNAGGAKRGPELVKPETLARIHAAKISTGRLVNPRPGTPTEGQYCMGWGLVKFDWTETPVLTHNGSNSFNFAKILVDPHRDVAIVVTTNFPEGKANDATNEATENLYRRFA
jgi:CubicO group peptidase (beta-lactamase class C family)